MEQVTQHHVQQQPPPRYPRAAQMIRRVKLGAGEYEALNLYISAHADAILSDDRGFLTLLVVRQIPYLTPAAVIVALCDWGILTIEDATHALALLRPLIRAEQHHAAVADLALLERKSSV